MNYLGRMDEIKPEDVITQHIEFGLPYQAWASVNAEEVMIMVNTGYEKDLERFAKAKGIRLQSAHELYRDGRNRVVTWAYWIILDLPKAKAFLTEWEAQRPKRPEETA